MIIPTRVFMGCLAVCVAFLFLAPLECQEAQKQDRPPTFRSHADLIRIDVSVLDRDRSPVRGLTVDDFMVLEDGLPQPIQTFSPVDHAEHGVADRVTKGGERSVAERRTDSPGRVLAIVMDDVTPADVPSATAVLHARRIATDIVDRLSASDVAAIVFPGAQSKGQDFTADKDKLRGAISKFSRAPDAYESLSGHAANPKGLAGLAEVRETYFRRRLLDSLQDVIASLAPVTHTRKTLVLISSGVALKGPDETREMFPVLVSAQTANVNIYPINPAGFDRPSSVTGAQTSSLGSVYASNPGAKVSPWFDRSGIAWPGADLLRGLAEHTGGFALVDVNVMGSDIDQILRENEVYYLLGYVPPDPISDTRQHVVEVRVKRPGLTVRARTVLLNSAQPTTSAESAATANAGEAGLPRDPSDASAIELRVEATPFASDAVDRAAVAIVTGLRLPSRAVREESVAEDVVLSIDAIGAGGQRVNATQMNARVTVRPPLRAIEGTAGSQPLTGSPASPDYELVARLDLPPGHYQLRLNASMSSPTTAWGSATCEVDVPDLSRPGIVLSGVVVSLDHGVVSAPKNALASLIPVVPTSIRLFLPDDQAKLFMRVYQTGAAPLIDVPVKARIANARGDTEFESASVLRAKDFEPTRAADYRLDLQLAQLMPGAYVLTIEAGSGASVSRRQVSFETK